MNSNYNSIINQTNIDDEDNVNEDKLDYIILEGMFSEDEEKTWHNIGKILNLYK